MRSKMTLTNALEQLPRPDRTVIHCCIDRSAAAKLAEHWDADSARVGRRRRPSQPFRLPSLRSSASASCFFTSFTQVMALSCEPSDFLIRDRWQV
jgi:hypothetical protein